MKPDRGVDWLTLLIATSGSAYGAFIPVYLTSQGWTQTRIGLVLTISTIASVVCLVPAGFLVDSVGPRRRRLLTCALLGVGIAPLTLSLFPHPFPVVAAMVLQAASGAVLTPAIAALSLALVGHDALGDRLGRNARYGSIGAGLGALVMGACATWGPERVVFLIAGLLMVPALLALRAVGPDRLDPEPVHEDETVVVDRFALLRDGRLVVFGLCLALFQIASIAVVQLSSVAVTARLGAQAGMVIAAFVVVPQFVAAWLSPWIGSLARRHGRRPVLLVGFMTVPIRGLLFSLIAQPVALIPVQALEGVGGSVFGVMMPLVAADLTRRTGYYSVCLGLLGLADGIGTAISPTLAGWVADIWGRQAAFWVLTGVGVAAVALLALAMPETYRPIAQRRAQTARTA